MVTRWLDCKVAKRVLSFLWEGFLETNFWGAPPSVLPPLQHFFNDPLSPKKFLGKNLIFFGFFFGGGKPPFGGGPPLGVGTPSLHSPLQHIFPDSGKILEEQIWGGNYIVGGNPPTPPPFRGRTPAPSSPLSSTPWQLLGSFLRKKCFGKIFWGGDHHTPPSSPWGPFGALRAPRPGPSAYRPSAYRPSAYVPDGTDRRDRQTEGLRLLLL